MLIRIYLSPRIGDGLSHETAFRPRFINYLDVSDRWEGMDHPINNHFLCCVWTTETAHEQIASDPLIFPLSDLITDDEDKKIKFNTRVSLDPEKETALKNILEAKGLTSKHKYKSVDTLKDILRIYIHDILNEQIKSAGRTGTVDGHRIIFAREEI